jgi:hypothetical protein
MNDTQHQYRHSIGKNIKALDAEAGRTYNNGCVFDDIRNSIRMTPFVLTLPVPVQSKTKLFHVVELSSAAVIDLEGVCTPGRDKVRWGEDVGNC